jgi:CHAT domain-containing protein
LHVIQLWERQRSAPSRPFWAVGDPIYERTDPRLTARADPPATTVGAATRPGNDVPGELFHRLPGSGREVDRLRQLMDAAPGDVLRAQQATESAVKGLSSSHVLARYRYIHFATHGTLGLADGRPPSLVLSLVHAPDGEDGFLRLDEVTGLELNADLVVLSACQTGQGQSSTAEGVTGLARAFLYAGSRSVLCSLWRVSDRETSDLMVDVYAGLKERPARDALRQAQRALIAAGEPPVYWAPFILIGR